HTHPRILPGMWGTGSSGGTILSGDLDSDDDPDGTIQGDNAYHVVISAEDVGTARLDGFTISGGDAFFGSSINVNGNSVDRESGGGMYIYRSSPLLTNVAITDNYAWEGGGMYNFSSSPVLTNVT